jgi:hypothetical protein
VKVCVKVSLVTQTFTAVYEAAEEGGYAAFVEEVPGAVSQGETLEDVHFEYQFEPIAVSR